MMPDEETMKALVSRGAMAADGYVIGFMGTAAERTKLAIWAALKCLIENRLVTVTPPADWPEFVVIESPPLGWMGNPT